MTGDRQDDHTIYGEGAQLAEDGVELTLSSELPGADKDNSTARAVTDVSLIFVMTCFLFWGVLYVHVYDGNWSSTVFDPTPRYLSSGGGDASGGVAAVAGPESFEDTGKRVYQTCQACHQPTGLGVAGTFPPLVGSPWATGSKERAINIVLSGLAGPIEVNGAQYNGAMIPLGALFKDLEIAAVLTYVRSQWGNSGSAISEEEVAAVRAEQGSRAAWSAPELLKLYPME